MCFDLVPTRRLIGFRRSCTCTGTWCYSECSLGDILCWCTDRFQSRHATGLFRIFSATCLQYLRFAVQLRTLRLQSWILHLEKGRYSTGPWLRFNDSHFFFLVNLSSYYFSSPHPPSTFLLLSFYCLHVLSPVPTCPDKILRNSSRSLYYRSHRSQSSVNMQLKINKSA